MRLWRTLALGKTKHPELMILQMRQQRSIAKHEIFKKLYYMSHNGQYLCTVTLKTHENLKWILTIADKSPFQHLFSKHVYFIV